MEKDNQYDSTEIAQIVHSKLLRIRTAIVADTWATAGGINRSARELVKLDNTRYDPRDAAIYGGIH